MVNKLVRDNIPNIIRDSGKIPIYHCIDNDSEFVQLLKCKLQEEVAEYIESGSVIELCDIVEVINALTNVHGISQTEFEHLRIKKATSNGTYDQRIFLSDILSDNSVSTNCTI